MSEGGRPSLIDRVRELAWAIFGLGLAVYTTVHLLAAVWVWMVVIGVVVGLAVAGWSWHRRNL